MCVRPHLFCRAYANNQKGHFELSTIVLRVRAVGNGLVPRFENLKDNTPSFVGREWCEVNGKFALRLRDEPTEVPHRAEYVRAVREGHLEPCDAATAAACGVAFKPYYSALSAPLGDS